MRASFRLSLSVLAMVMCHVPQPSAAAEPKIDIIYGNLLNYKIDLRDPAITLCWEEIFSPGKLKACQTVVPSDTYGQALTCPLMNVGDMAESFMTIWRNILKLKGDFSQIPEWPAITGFAALPRILATNGEGTLHASLIQCQVDGQLTDIYALIIDKDEVNLSDADAEKGLYPEAVFKVTLQKPSK